MWFHNSMASCVVLRVSTFGTFSSTKRLQQPSVITAYVLFPTRATQLLRNLPLLISQWTCPNRQMMGAICFIIFINDGRFAASHQQIFFLPLLARPSCPAALFMTAQSVPPRLRSLTPDKLTKSHRGRSWSSELSALAATQCLGSMALESKRISPRHTAVFTRVGLWMTK